MNKIIKIQTHKQKKKKETNEDRQTKKNKTKKKGLVQVLIKYL